MEILTGYLNFNFTKVESKELSIEVLASPFIKIINLDSTRAEKN